MAGLALYSPITELINVVREHDDGVNAVKKLFKEHDLFELVINSDGIMNCRHGGRSFYAGLAEHIHLHGDQLKVTILSSLEFEFTVVAPIAVGSELNLPEIKMNTITREYDKAWLELWTKISENLTCQCHIGDKKFNGYGCRYMIVWKNYAPDGTEMSYTAYNRKGEPVGTTDSKEGLQDLLERILHEV